MHAGEPGQIASLNSKSHHLTDGAWSTLDLPALLPGYAFAQLQPGAFVTTWETATAGETITIPATGTYRINWGDGTTTENATDSRAHTYAAAGIHTISISGDLERIDLRGSLTDAAKLKSINQWGDIGWESMDSAFLGAKNMVYDATDKPDLSQVASMEYMFSGATSFNGDISSWDVSGVQYMNDMFYNATEFNGDISSWNVSSVTEMGGMFKKARNFDQPLSSWAVSSVNDMSDMFYSATSFNRPLSSWDVSSVGIMDGMFRGATSFNQPLSSWDVSDVFAMDDMFLDAGMFVDNLGAWYVVPAETSIARTDVPGVVGAISAQNTALRNHDAAYGIGTGGDSERFEIVDGYDLRMKSVDTKSSYQVNVTASGPRVFESDNNWHMVDVTVSGQGGITLIADAGNDMEVNEEDTATLQGTGSTGSGVTYLWTQSPQSPAITFDDTASLTPVITAPLVDGDTGITLTLTVRNGTNSATDNMTLTIRNVNNAPDVNSPPTADAGDDLEVNEGGSITLQGSGSDANSDYLTYAWSSNPLISYDNQTSPTPQVTAHSVTGDTQITLTLTVDDGTAPPVRDTMVLTILDVTTATVSVGPDQTVKEGAAVSMTWTAGIPSGETPSYSWSQNPASPAVTLASRDSSPTTFTAPQVDADTAFTFTLAVTAGQHTVEDSLTITVKNNRPPTADAGSDRIVNERTAVTLSGSARDLDGDKMTYAWTQDSGTSVDLTGSNTTRPQFTAPGVTAEEGIIFRFTATDTAGESANDTVTIRVRDVPITVSSATYSRSGTMTITFNQDIRDSPIYDMLHIRNASSDAGGIALSDVADKSHSGRTITVTLDTAQQDEYNALQRPQLDIGAGAVTDADGIGIEEALDVTIRSPSSGKRSSTLPPAVDLNTLASRGVDIPSHLTDITTGSQDYQQGTARSESIQPIPAKGLTFPLVIHGNGYALLSSTNTVVPTSVTAGLPVTIQVTVHDPTPISYFAIYLHLQGDQISHLQSDAQVIWDSGVVRTVDPNDLMHDVTMTVSENSDDPAMKIATLTTAFSEGMGETNMAVRTWNSGGQLAEVQIFDALVVTAPETGTLDPEPTESPVLIDPEPTADSDSAASSLLAIRMWSGFEPDSMTDAQLLASLGLDYPGADIPSWVMTELGALVANSDVTVDEFVLALTYVLENS